MIATIILLASCFLFTAYALVKSNQTIIKLLRRIKEMEDDQESVSRMLAIAADAAGCEPGIFWQRALVAFHKELPALRARVAELERKP